MIQWSLFLLSRIRFRNAVNLQILVVQSIIVFRDRERHRVIWNDVFMHQPIMDGEFRAVQKYVMKHGAHAWSSERSNKIYMKYEHVEHVQKFIQEWRAKAAAASR